MSDFTYHNNCQFYYIIIMDLCDAVNTLTILLHITHVISNYSILRWHILTSTIMSIIVKSRSRRTLTTIGACHIDTLMRTSTIVSQAFINICNNMKNKTLITTTIVHLPKHLEVPAK